MDLATLRKLKPSAFEQAADAYRATSDMAAAAKDRIDDLVAADMRKSLAGTALEASLKELKRLSADFQYTQTECGLVSTALDGFAQDMNAARGKLLSALDDAEALKLSVNPDGSVTYPEGPPAQGAQAPSRGGTVHGFTDPGAGAVARQSANFDPNPHHREALGIAERILRALTEAREADAKWAPRIRALRADDDLTVSDRDWADAQSDMAGVAGAADRYVASIEPPPKGALPEDNARWWKNLTPEQRAACVALHPDAIGALDGLPAKTRDAANRVVFAETKARYALELAAVPAEPARRYTVVMTAEGPVQMYSKEWLEWDGEYSARRARLESVNDGMNAIQARFDRTGEQGLPQAYLLGFDPVGRGDGKVILANGNPDTADHTAVYVPGTGTNLGGIQKDLQRGEILWAESHNLAPEKNISTITWFDYDAPRSAYPGDKGDFLPEAMNDKYAEKSGPTLRKFLDGSRIAHQGESGVLSSRHTTLIGHSYGTTVIGDAAKSGVWGEGPLAADDVIALGSPGMQADRAADLGIRSGHMWAEEGGGSDNFVTIGGKMVGLGDNWTIPTDFEFGANIMESDAKDHGAYWDIGPNGTNASVSLQNQARVVVGDYGRVTLD